MQAAKRALRTVFEREIYGAVRFRHVREALDALEERRHALAREAKTARQTRDAAAATAATHEATVRGWRGDGGAFGFHCRTGLTLRLRAARRTWTRRWSGWRAR